MLVEAARFLFQHLVGEVFELHPDLLAVLLELAALLRGERAFCFEFAARFLAILLRAAQRLVERPAGFDLPIQLRFEVAQAQVVAP